MHLRCNSQEDPQSNGCGKLSEKHRLPRSATGSNDHIKRHEQFRIPEESADSFMAFIRYERSADRAALSVKEIICERAANEHLVVGLK